MVVTPDERNVYDAYPTLIVDLVVVSTVFQRLPLDEMHAATQRMLVTHTFTAGSNIDPDRVRGQQALIQAAIEYRARVAELLATIG